MELEDINRREFLKGASLLGLGIMFSTITFGDNMGYFKMKQPAHFILWGDTKIEEKFIICQTSHEKSFEHFIERNWKKDKSIFVYQVMNSPLNGKVMVRSAVLDIPPKLIKDTMCYDRRFVPVNKV